jgi:hypothetical protein
MDEVASYKDKERWDRVGEKMEQMELNQRKMDTRFDTTGKVFEQMLKDQQALAKQIEANGQAITWLTIDQMENRQESHPGPTSSEASLENIFYK